MAWTCAIDGCEQEFGTVEDLLLHQARDHDDVTCDICGASMPDGYPALRHVIKDHTRAEYVRTYGPSGDEIRIRERITEYVEAEADLEAVAAELEGE